MHCLVQRIRLALRIVRICYGVDDKLCLLARDLFVVLLDVAQVVSTSIVSFSDTHRIVGEVDIAVVAEEFRHIGA